MINKIYNENCLDTMDRMLSRNIQVDLIVTSPPYDNARKYKGYKFDFQSIAKKLIAIMKSGGVLVWVVGDETINGSETGTSLKQTLYFINSGLKLHDTMIYAKYGLPLSHNRYEQSFEYMFVFSKGKPKTFNPIRVKCKHVGSGVVAYPEREKVRKKQGEDKSRIRRTAAPVQPTKIRGNIWLYAPHGKQRFSHPAMFPKQLVVDHILSWSNKNDIVYDPCMGSGTVAEAAINTGRKYIGSEISKEYYDGILNRVYFITNHHEGKKKTSFTKDEEKSS